MKIIATVASSLAMLAAAQDAVTTAAPTFTDSPVQMK